MQYSLAFKPNAEALKEIKIYRGIVFCDSCFRTKGHGWDIFFPVIFIVFVFLWAGYVQIGVPSYMYTGPQREPRRHMNKLMNG